ncbi:MAG: hypothetical protein ASARMPREDX12_009074 [Alectoria sarmentosa]|nr:MAG: hypothetical protein ASARMPREDX12_009074 [Alectoria sarmentosa]
MYKSRFKQWGLDIKNNKEPEMRVSVCKMRQRSSQGKSSQLRVRGKCVRWEDVVHYWERKGMSVGDVSAKGTNAATHEAVQCLTPILSSMATPEILATPEQIFSTIHDYCRGSFEAGTWIRTDPKTDCDTTKGLENGLFQLNAFYELFVTAYQLFALGSCEEAGKTLIAATATAGIKMILSSEHPYILKTLLDLVLRSDRHGRREVAVIVLKQFSALGELILGGSHPLRRLCGWLAATDPSHTLEVVFKSLQILETRFGSILGPMHRSTLRLHCDYIRFGGYGDDIDQERVDLNDLLSKCISAFGPCDGRTLRVYLELAIHFCVKSRYIEAERAAQTIMHLAASAQPVSSSTHFWVEGLYQSAVSQHGLRDEAAAEAKLRLAIELSISQFGGRDARARNWLVELERWLREGGQLLAADEVQARREGMIQPADLI